MAKTAADKVRERKRYEANREEIIARVRARKLKRKFGISLPEYEALLIQQAGRCAICGCGATADRYLAVDHCHETKTLRGLLCFHCNVGLGHFNDDPTRLAVAIHYLEEEK